MSWLLIVILAHLLNAGAFLVDKFLLAKAVPKPAVYAFWIGVLGALALVLVPIDYVQPSFSTLVTALVAGATFEGALLFFFSALQRLDASRVVPVIGGLQPLIIFVLAYTFLGERLEIHEITALVLLVTGSALISYDPRARSTREEVRRRWGWTAAIVAACFFALSFTLTKAVFEQTPFFSGLGWIRLGSLLVALLFLLSRTWRRDILAREERPRGSFAALFVAGQVGGAFGAILLNYAIKLSTPTLVTAMQGMQYVFLFVFAFILGRRYVQLREQISLAIVARKSVAILCIGVSLFFLA